MAKKRRTKKDKIIANLRRQLKTKKNKPKKSASAPKPTPGKKKKPAKKTNKPNKSKQSIFAYPPELIKKELVKTLIISLIFLILITAIKVFNLLNFIPNQLVKKITG